MLVLGGQSFLTLPDWLMWLGAAFVLLMVAVPSVLLWRAYLNRKRRQLRAQRLRTIRQVVIGIAEYHAQSANAFINQNLANIAKETISLEKELKATSAQSKRIVDRMIARATVKNNATLIEYYLYDLKQCDNWVEMLTKQEVYTVHSRNQAADGSGAEATPNVPIYQIIQAIILETVRGRLLGQNAVQLIDIVSTNLGSRESAAHQLAAI